MRQAIQDEINRRGGDFKKAMDAGGFTMSSGVPIKKVRIEAHTTNPRMIRIHTATPSKNEYKNSVYVDGGMNFRLAIYEKRGSVPGHDEIEFVTESLLDYVQKKIQTSSVGLRFIGYIFPGAMAIAYQHKGEWKESGFKYEHRLYEVVKFSQGRITLRHHQEARRMTDLQDYLVASGKNKKGQSSFDFEQSHELLLISEKKAWASFLFEGIHFTMGLDGKIEFKN